MAKTNHLGGAGSSGGDGSGSGVASADKSTSKPSASRTHTLSDTPSGGKLLIVLLFIVAAVLGLFALYALVSYYLIAAWMHDTPWWPSVSAEGIAARGQFGDTFGFITALFTGLGFAGVAVTLYAQWSTLKYQTTTQDYLAEQIELLRESTEAETRAVYMQRSATSMDILTRMRESFDRKELRKSRYVASKFFLDAQNSESGKRTPEPALDAAIRDILSFFEQMAHFTNRSGIDEVMVLNAFYIRLEAYYHFAEKFVLPDDHASSVAWAEIRKLREKGHEWLKLEYFTQGSYKSKDDVPKEIVQQHTSSDALTRVLKRESVRCKEVSPLRGCANRLATFRT